MVHRVGVHDPGHDLGIGVHVGGGNVAVRADHARDFGGIAAGQALQLRRRQLPRIDDHAALGAAEGDIDDRALPGHPHRQRAHLVERDVGVEADAALGRAAIDVVLDAVAGEHLDAPIVHAHGKIDDQLALGHAQNGAQALGKLQTFGGGVELGDRLHIGIDDLEFFDCHNRSS